MPWEVERGSQANDFMWAKEQNVQENIDKNQ